MTRNRIARWLIAFHMGIALGYLGLLIRAAVDGLLWRADVTAFYTGGAIVRQGLGPYLYDLDLQARVQQAILGPGRMFYDGVLPFNNPPHFALVMAPFSLLPLGPAYWCWTALQVGILVRLIQRLRFLSAEWERRERRMLAGAFFAFFPLFLQFLHGSLSLFVLWCLTEFYLALREGRDARAGVWLALAAVKPQAALFPALVLLAGRRWRALLGAGAAGLVIFGVTAAALGPSIWPDYLRWLATTASYFDHFGVYPSGMINLKGTLTFWLGAERAPLIQAITGILLAAGALGVLLLWARQGWEPGRPPFDLRLSFTLLLGALLSPHQNQQDCLIYALPIVLFYGALHRTGLPTRPLTAFLQAWPVLFLLEPFAIQGRLGIRLPVALTVILLVWIGVQQGLLSRGSPMMLRNRFLSLYRWLRWPLLLLAGAGLFFFAAWRLTQPDILHGDDAVEYWAAGRLNATGQNPYDPALLLPLEWEAGRPLEDPLMMWNPPWVLALVMPLGLLPYPPARVFWFLIHLSAVFFTSLRMGKEAGPPSLVRQGLAILLGLSFGPTLHALKAGQITPLMLLSLIGFLYHFRRRRWVMAGAMAALGLIKPHLLYLFIIALFLDTLAHRRWGILLGFVGALALSSALATVANPRVWEQYIGAVTHNPPRDWATPTLGGLLRLFVGIEHSWLQFLPPVLGLLWLLFYWHRHRQGWRWEQHFLLLVLISVTTAAYGWSFDLLVVLVALIPVLLRLLEIRRRPAAMALLAAYLIVDVVSLFTSFVQFFYVWLGPFFLVWYLLAQRTMGGDFSLRRREQVWTN